MKVLQINAVYGYGSTGRTALELTTEIKKYGWESLTIFSHAQDGYADSKKICSNVHNKFNALVSRAIGTDSHNPFGVTRKVLKIIKKHNPDVVHLRNLHANYVNLPKLLKFLAKNDIATVVSLHDCWFYTGKCTHYITIGCDKWQKECGKCPQLKNDVPSWFFDRTAKQLKEKRDGFNSIPRLAVIGVSDWITNEAKKSLLKNAKIIKRIYNWIDINTFYPRNVDIREKYNLPKDKFLILFAGSDWKTGTSKFNDLINLSKKLSSSQQIVLIGKVSSDINLPKNVTTLGYINNTDELAEINSGCDVYVHVSRADTFGKVVAEALACGTPAIVYNNTALPELIGENCGYVVETGDVDAIKESIDKIQANGKSKYSQSCIEFVNINFNKEKLVKETADLYNFLINSK